MAGLDYYSCDNCGAGKRFYDANIDWEEYGKRIGQIRCICDECYDEGIRLKITGGGNLDIRNNIGVHKHTKDKEFVDAFLRKI